MKKFINPKKANGLLLLLLICCGSCKKFLKDGYMDQPGIALTFDDDRVNNWIKFLPMLDEAGAKVTFYISSYASFTAEQKANLAMLRDHGHEIAFHSSTHVNMVDYTHKNKHSMQELVQKEINAAMDLMKRDGYDPITFAYPYGAHNDEIDNELQNHFKSLRALNGTSNFSKSLAALNENTMLFGLGIDRSSKRTDDDITKLMDAARDNRCCAVMVAHDINSDGKYSVAADRLKMIFTYVKNNNLRYYTASEISRH